MRMKSQMVLAAENGLCARVAKVEEEELFYSETRGGKVKTISAEVFCTTSREI